LTANHQGANQLDVLAVDTHGTLNVSWVVGGGTWQRPVGISPANYFPAGTSLASEHQGVNQLDVLAIDTHGTLNVSWVVGAGTWQGPVGISPANYFGS
jgi:hypothetical protein